jgi:predicted ABC-type ATPase
MRNFVNADLIAAPERAALQAGRLMLGEIRRLAAEKADFAFETTLSGRTYEAMLREFRAQGYRICLYFLWLPDVSMNLERVAARVRQGGHNVPEDDVRRRYRRGIANFLTVYRQLADSWTLFDNSGRWPREIAFALGDESTILDTEAFQRFTEAGQEI